MPKRHYKEDNARKEKKLTVKFYPKEYEELKVIAQDNNVNISEFIRLSTMSWLTKQLRKQHDKYVRNIKN